jgi:peptidoglycan/xylan/chitin deacetylase (PgdA/CDA1 family)
MKTQGGILLISLDFEQYWGVKDIISLPGIREKILATPEVIPSMLDLFQRYQIHATWATVGLLFFQNREELLRGLPRIKPQYINKTLSPYPGIEGQVGWDEREDPCRLAPSLIQKIAATPHQEIASHTFSHYYCLAEGQNIEAFRADLEAAVNIARKYHFALESLVFPRNHINPDYLPVCRELGIRAYRGNPPDWVYRQGYAEKQPQLRRRLTFLDKYVNLLGHQAYSQEDLGRVLPLNLRASRCLFPFNEKFRGLEPLRLRRIKSDLSYTARKGLIYHLWWHPHDFGLNQKENLTFLERILEHYASLTENYGIKSLTMTELAARLLSGEENR